MKFKKFNPTEISIKDTYQLLISGIAPRPIALVSSIDLNGAKQKFNELKKNLPALDKDSKTGEKPLDNYSKDDLQKLNDILKSVEKK